MTKLCLPGAAHREGCLGAESRMMCRTFPGKLLREEHFKYIQERESNMKDRYIMQYLGISVSDAQQRSVRMMEV